MKKVILSLLSAFIFLLPVTSNAILFSDLDGHWSEEHVYWAVFDVPVFSGYPDGTFRPDDPISRAEFISMVKKILDTSSQTVVGGRSVTMPFSDVTDRHWAYDHIRFVYQYLMEAPQADLTLKDIFDTPLFRPNQPISRYEVALLTHSLTTPPLQTGSLRTQFSDILPSDPHYHRIYELVENGLVSGYEDGTFRPANQLTRGESSVMVRKIHQDLDYLTPDRLTIQQPQQAALYRYPTFDMPSLRSDYTAMDRRMANVIATLEYLSIVGFIPFDEQDLYDPDPIDTLWNLKNDDYPHIIVNNYYLIAHDQSLQRERKQELATEALITYLEHQTVSMEGLSLLLEAVRDYAPVELQEEVIRTALRSNSGAMDRASKAILLSTLLAEQGRVQEGLSVYGPLITTTSDMELKVLLIQNEVVMRYQHFGTQEALKALQHHWDVLKNGADYWFHEEWIQHELMSLAKQLMVQ